MVSIAKVAVDLQANSAAFTAGLTRADAALAASAQKWDRNLSSMESRVSAAALAMKRALAGIAGGISVETLFSTNAEYQKLGASLKTVTGSSAGASAALSKLTTFAQETPYQLTEVTEAFVKLKAMGLDASMDSLRSYGNTASAMGKSLDQMVEAVADAVTGEFERLKEFGIKASQEGDKVTFTFKGVSTTVGKNASDIEAYLKRIGDIEFAGAMSEQMETLGGKMSNLRDQFDALMVAIGRAGANKAMSEGLTATTTGIQHLTETVDILASTRSGLEKWFEIASKFSAVRAFLAPFAVAKMAGIPDVPTSTPSYSAPMPAPIEKPVVREAPVDKEAERRAAAIQKQIEALKFEESQLDRTSREQAIYQALQQAGVDISTKEGQVIADVAGRLYDRTQAAKDSAAAQEELAKADQAEIDAAADRAEARVRISGSMEREIEDNDRLIAALSSSKAEYERVAAAVDVLNQYKAAGIELTPEEVEQVESLTNRLGDQKTQLDEIKQKSKEAATFGKELGMSFSSAFEDAVVEGKALSDVLKGILQDVVRLLLRATVTQPLTSAMSTALSGFSLTKFFGFANGTNSAPPGMAWVGERGPELVKFRGGEQVYPSGLSGKIASAWALPGFAGGAFDSRQLVANSNIGVGGGGVAVNITNKAGADVSATGRRNADGGVDIEVMIDQAVAKKLGQRGSASNRAVRQTFGGNERLTGR